MRNRNCSENTVAQRLKFMQHRREAWGTLNVGSEVVSDYLAQFHGWTLCTYYTHLCSIYAWAVPDGHADANPLADMARPRTPKPCPRPLDRDDAARSIAGASGDLLAALLLGRYAGLRAHEIAKIRGEDITEVAIYVYGKGGKAAMLPTHPRLWDLAQSYPREGYWFPSARTGVGHISSDTVSHRVSRHFAALGIAGSSHRNRHLYGTNLLRGGAHLRIVQELMRHSNLATTALYLGVDEDEKQAAIRNLLAA
jgi:integrase/recombinase XerD